MTTSGRTQRRLLWVCLGSIALCGLTAVSAVLFDSGGRNVGDILATTFYVGMAAILALPASAAEERDRWSPLGVGALVLIGVGLIGILVMIWIPTFVWPSGGFSEGFEWAVLFVAGMAVWASLTSALALARYRRGFAWMRWATIGCMGLCLVVLWLVATGFDWWGSSNYLKRLGSLRWIGAALGLAYLLTWIIGCRSGASAGWRTYLRVLLGAVALVVLLLGLSILFEFDQSMDWVARSGAAAGILSVAGLVGSGVLHRMTTMAKQEAVFTTRLELRLFCPRCNSDQTLPAGHAACGKCGLKMKVEIEEEQCGKCGYVLFGLSSSNCPECGAEITSRWAGVAMPSAAAVASGAQG